MKTRRGFLRLFGKVAVVGASISAFPAQALSCAGLSGKVEPNAQNKKAKKIALDFPRASEKIRAYDINTDSMVIETLKRDYPELAGKLKRKTYKGEKYWMQ
jgi:hypothetical protein